MKLTDKDLELIIAWGKSAKRAGFGDNQFNRNDDNRKLLNRIIRLKKTYRDVGKSG